MTTTTVKTAAAIRNAANPATTPFAIEVSLIEGSPLS
jgi:hypothetical protein